MNQNYKIPSNPAKTYGEDWTGWDDLFGTVKKWGKPEVLEFILALEKEIEFLDSYEILRIVEQSGAKFLFKNNNNFKQLLESSPLSEERNEIISNIKTELGYNVPQKDKQKEAENIEVINYLESEYKISPIETVSNFIKPNNFITELKAFDSNAMTSYVDIETIEVLIKYKIDKLWNDIMSKGYDVEILRKENGGEYFTIIKKIFLNEYDNVSSLRLPDDYQFKDNNGNIALPNVMQKLIVYRLQNHKQYGNWSSMGAGKTLSAILASRIIGLKNTLVITFNSNIEDWERSILSSFPDNTRILSKKKNKIPKLNDDKYNYIVFNYEMFQREDESEKENNIVDLITSNDIDFIVLDEVQMVKQRYEDDYSNRKKLVEFLIKIIECKNKKRHVDTYKLFMSATPVINNLLEPKKTLELLKGIKYSDLKTKPNINNALNINKQMFNNGVRFTPSYGLDVETLFLKINGQHLLNSYLQIPRERALEIEKLFIPDKLMAIKNHLKRGTIIYTHYVSGIIEPVKKFVEMFGFKVGLYTGLDKSGLESFKSGNCDILLCSSPVGTGVDGLQFISDQIIILTLPWTNSEYENLLGRINRQGTAFKKIKIIIPQVEINIFIPQLGKDIPLVKHSYDTDRMNVVNNKKTLSNVVLDAIIPSHLIKDSKELVEEARGKFKDWIKRIENDGLIQISREKLLMCIDDGVIEIEQKPYDDFVLEEIYQELIGENLEIIPEITRDEKIDKKVERELREINKSLGFKEIEHQMSEKSTLLNHQKKMMEKSKSKFNIPVRINDTTVIYVDDLSKVDAIKLKYGLI